MFNRRHAVLVAVAIVLVALVGAKNTLQVPVWQEMYQTVPGQWHYTSTVLWNESLPYYKDPLQVHVNDCWLPAVIAAIAWVNPEWIAHLFYYPDGTPMLGGWYPASKYVTLQLWNPASGAATNVSVNYYNESLSEDRPGGLWWPSALGQGMGKMAQITTVRGFSSNGSIVPNVGIPSAGLAVMTGKFAQNDIVNTAPGNNTLPFDDWFKILIHSRNSPVVVSTLPNGQTDPSVKGEHAFAVLETKTNADGTKAVVLRNPWGYNEEFDARTVWASSWLVNYLAGFPDLTW